MERILTAITAAADWFDHVFGGMPEVNGNEPYFDSDAYLAQVRHKIETYYY